jgi:prevent-host-death family protein
MAMKRVSVAEAKNHLPALIREAEETPVEIMRRGKPVAVLMCCATFDRLRGRRSDAWEALERWRASVDLESLDLEDVFHGVRDRSAGRRGRALLA